MPGLPGSHATAQSVADWIELEVLFGYNTVVSRSELVAFLREEMGLDELRVFDEMQGDLDTGDEDDLRDDLRQAEAEGDDASTILADDAMLILSGRSELLGERYPLDVTADAAQLRDGLTDWSDSLVYAFLALLSARIAYGTPQSIVGTNTPSKLFERLTVVALATYWNGQSKHVGFPRDDGKNFADAVVGLCQDLAERMTVKKSDIPKRLKDLAVDVVAWKRMDTRSGNSILLCQCAIGGDWESKGIRHEPWDTLVKFSVKPRTATAFPVIPEATRDYSVVEWELLCAVVGIPLDRLRLSALIDPADVDGGLRAAIEAWVRGHSNLILA